MPWTLITIPVLTDKQITRFWQCIDTSGGNSACWPWGAFKTRQGYGRLRLNQYGFIAHRVSFWLATGEQPMVVMHECDNPPCCNPQHLKAGTPAQNQRDAIARGRKTTETIRGERHYEAKLTESQVREIRRRYAAGNISLAALAREFGVYKSTPVKIIAGKTWKHVI